MDTYISYNAIFSIFSKKYMDKKKDLPIRPSEMGVLNIITETEGPHTPVMLSSLLSVSKPMITAHITSLESKGYITKSPSERDKRAYYILPTEKAKKLVEKTKLELKNDLDTLINGLGQEDFNTLLTLIKKANTLL